MFESLTDVEEQRFSLDSQCDTPYASQEPAAPTYATLATVSTASPCQPLAPISSPVILLAETNTRKLSFSSLPLGESEPLVEALEAIEPVIDSEPAVPVSISPVTPTSNRAASTASSSRPLAPIFSPAFSPGQSNARRLSFGRFPSSDINPLAGTADRTRTAAAAPAAYNIVCKTCSKQLFSCSEKPKIKAIQKSMANELYLYFQQRRQAQQAAHPRLAAASPPRTFTRTLSESSLNGDGGTLSRNILTVSPSSVLELTPEIQGDQEELECVWRSQDGLCYRRIICSRCSLTTASTATGSVTPSAVDGSPSLIAGWRGVMIVGASYGQGSVAESTETGTIWLIQGEFQVV
ncbi:unnamed protein product [Mortierella alpina]